MEALRATRTNSRDVLAFFFFFVFHVFENLFLQFLIFTFFLTMSKGVIRVFFCLLRPADDSKGSLLGL